MSSRWRRRGVDNPCHCSLGGDDETGMRVMQDHPSVGGPDHTGLSAVFRLPAGTAGSSAAPPFWTWDQDFVGRRLISNSFFFSTHGGRQRPRFVGTAGQSHFLADTAHRQARNSWFASARPRLFPPSRFPLSLPPHCPHCHTSPTRPLGSL